MSASEEPRRYRLPPLVRAGLFGGMPATQVAVLGAGAAVSFLGLLADLFPWAALPLLGAAIVAFGRAGPYQLHELIPLKVSWWRRRHRGELRWCRPIPLLGAGQDVPVALPPAMAGLELLEATVSWAAPGRLAGAAVVHDRPAGMVTAAIRAHGDGQFSLVGPLEQDNRVALWGEAIAGFCRENPAVAQVAWHEWTATGGVEDHLEEVRALPVGPVGAEARQRYLGLVERVRPTSITHETLIAVSVDVSRVRLRRRQGGDAVAAAVDTVLEELRLFSGRLEAAGLSVDAVLSPAELTTALRRRSDPAVSARLGAFHRSLAAELGVAAADFGPMAVAEDWGHVRVDGSLHRSYWVYGWPRLEVPAAWMDPLLLGVHAHRSVTVVFEPVAPSAAARAVDQAAVALDSAEHTRARHGFRVRAADRRSRAEVDQRERELVAGYGAVGCAGLVTLTATGPDELDNLAADYESVAGHAGVLLMPLDARHAAGWVASLPLGRTLAERREAFR